MGEGCAVVCREDTGQIVDRHGPLLGDEVSVLPDKSKTVIRVENRLVVTKEWGKGVSRFHHDDFFEDTLGRNYPHLTVLVEYSENAQKQQRKAVFKYILRPGETSRPNDPFYKVVINGNSFVRWVYPREKDI